MIHIKYSSGILKLPVIPLIPCLLNKKSGVEFIQSIQPSNLNIILWLVIVKSKDCCNKSKFIFILMKTPRNHHFKFPFAWVGHLQSIFPCWTSVSIFMQQSLTDFSRYVPSDIRKLRERKYWRTLKNFLGLGVYTDNQESLLGPDIGYM